MACVVCGPLLNCSVFVTMCFCFDSGLVSALISLLIALSIVSCVPAPIFLWLFFFFFFLNPVLLTFCYEAVVSVPVPVFCHAIFSWFWSRCVFYILDLPVLHCLVFPWLLPVCDHVFFCPSSLCICLPVIQYAINPIKCICLYMPDITVGHTAHQIQEA